MGKKRGIRESEKKEKIVVENNKKKRRISLFGLLHVENIIIVMFKKTHLNIKIL